VLDWLDHPKSAGLVGDLSTCRDFAGQIIRWGDGQDPVSNWVWLRILAVADSEPLEVLLSTNPPPTPEQPLSSVRATFGNQ